MPADCSPTFGAMSRRALRTVLAAAVALSVLHGDWCLSSPSEYLASWEVAERARCKAGGTPAGLTPPAEIENRDNLKDAIVNLRKGMTGLRLGIMAPTAEKASESLNEWLRGLALPGVDVRIVDEQNQPADSDISGAVYLKYSYSEDSGDPKVGAYMKPYPFAGRGVLFNPDLEDGMMHMYGDFPLALFGE